MYIKYMQPMPNEISSEKKKSPLLVILLTLLILGGLIFGVYKMVTANKPVEQDNANNVIDDLDEDADEEDVDEEVIVEDDTDEDTSEDDDTVDFSLYSETNQSVGQSSNEARYTLKEILDSQESGYHKFTFVMEGKSGATDEPNVTARYVSSLGSIRIDLNGTTTDSAGIPYQDSRKIDKDGISVLYHNVSSDQTEELYDIGVSASTPFYIYTTGVSTGLWNVVVEVKYSGKSDVTVDLGATAYSKTAQTISGGTKSDGAKVSSYTYSASGGILTVVWNVSGSTSKPIPNATAGYDGDGDLILRFISAADTIAKQPSALDMPGGITMIWEGDGDGSKYTFDGASKDFKLSASTSPNQVILKIKL